jgi:hypothetical protein
VLLWLWLGEIPDVDAAKFLLSSCNAADAWNTADFSFLMKLSLNPVPNPKLSQVWTGFWMSFGGCSPATALLSFLPGQLALSAGIFLGTRALQSPPFPTLLLAWSLPLLLVVSHRVLLDGPFFGASALLIGGLLARNDPAAIVGLLLGVSLKLSAGPGFALLYLYGVFSAYQQKRPLLPWFFPVLWGLILYLPGIETLLQYSAGNANISPEWQGFSMAPKRLLAHLQSTAKAGLLLAPGLLWMLLKNPSRPSFLCLLFGFTYLLGISISTHTPQLRYILPALPALILAASRSPSWLLVGLALLQGGSSLYGTAFIERSLILEPSQDRQAMALVLSELEQLRGPAPRLRIKLILGSNPLLSVDAFAAMAAEKKLPLDFLEEDLEMEADLILTAWNLPRPSETSLEILWPGRGTVWIQAAGSHSSG